MDSLSQIELGKRISKLRKAKGMSQADLACLISLPRPSLTQIELGNRSTSVIELKRIAAILSVPIERFFVSDFEEEYVVISKTANTEGIEMRVSVPELNVEKLKEILLYILEKCAGKPNIGETVLYKLLYFSDFNYYELYEEHLSGAEYRKLPYGPVPYKLDSIITKMLEDKLLQRVKTEYHGYPQTRYIPLLKPDLKKLKASEKDVLDKVIEQYSDWSASSLSEYSHKDMPWLASKDGEVIDYELVFYREHPYSVRNYNEDYSAG